MSEQTRILAEVVTERQKQDERWGVQDHEDLRWLAILTEEVGEVAETLLEDDPVCAGQELVQVAAVAVAWLEAIDRRQGG